MSRRLSLVLGGEAFEAELEPGLPRTQAWLVRRLPFEGTLLHARWSGEAGWARLGQPFDLPPENATAHPAPGQLLLYPGGVSEPELLIPYGPCAFASRAGPLAGAHFATLQGDLDRLRVLGEGLLLTGAQPLRLAWL